MHRLGLLVVMFLVIGCGNFRREWPAVIRSVDAFELDEQVKVMEAIEELNETAPQKLISEDPLVGYAIAIRRVPPNPDFPNRIGYAIVRPTSCTIELSERLFDDLAHMLKSVIYHEIGHCAGLGHVEESQEIMSANASAFDRFTQTHFNNFFDLIFSSIELLG